MSPLLLLCWSSLSYLSLCPATNKTSLSSVISICSKLSKLRLISTNKEDKRNRTNSFTIAITWVTLSTTNHLITVKLIHTWVLVIINWKDNKLIFWILSNGKEWRTEPKNMQLSKITLLIRITRWNLNNAIKREEIKLMILSILMKTILILTIFWRNSKINPSVQTKVLATLHKLPTFCLKPILLFIEIFLHWDYK